MGARVPLLVWGGGVLPRLAPTAFSGGRRSADGFSP
jgi:hypothetical protein